MTASLHHRTPQLAVSDSRSLAVRQVNYWRACAEQAAQRRIALTRQAPSGQLREQWDPRLFERQDAGEPVSPCQHLLTTLSGSWHRAPCQS